jgi:hypothetical protein
MKKTLLTILAIAITVTAFAQGHQPTHMANHPRVDQVNRRVDRQAKRINTERRDGQLSKSQAHQDRKDLRETNQEKRDMRRQDNGHLTKADQHALNQNLNKNNKKINQ